MKKYGNEVLYNGQSGRQLECSIFIGPTYYQRLKHMVQDKMHSRGGGGPKMSLTKQPNKGRGRGGGGRIGEMERDSLLSHGVAGFLKESTVDRSDGPSKEKKIPSVFIDSKDGMIGIVNKSKNIHKSAGTNNKFTFSEVNLPYATKLFLQEMQVLGITPRLLTSSNNTKWKRIPYTKEELMGSRVDFVIEDKVIVDSQYVKHIIGSQGKVKRRIISSSQLETLDIVPTLKLNQQIIVLRGTGIAIQKAKRQIYDIIDMLQQRLFIATKELYVSNRYSSYLLDNNAQVIKDIRSKYGNKVFINVQLTILEKKMPGLDSSIPMNKLILKGPDQIIETIEKELKHQSFLYPPETYYNPLQWGSSVDILGLPEEYSVLDDDDSLVIQLGKYLVFRHEPTEEEVIAGDLETYIYYYNQETGKATMAKPEDLYYYSNE